MRTKPEGFDEPDDRWVPLWQFIFELPNLESCLSDIFREPEFEIRIEKSEFSSVSVEYQNGDVYCETNKYGFYIYWEYTENNNELENEDPTGTLPYKNKKYYKYWHQAMVLFFDDVEENPGTEYNIARRIIVRLRDAFNIALDQAVETKLISVYGRRNNMDEPFKLIEPSKWGSVTVDDWTAGDAHLKGDVHLFGLMAERGPNWPQENAPLKASDDEIIAFAKQVIADNGGDISQENGAIKLREKYPDLHKKKAMEIIKSLIGQQRPGRRSRRIN